MMHESLPRDVQVDAEFRSMITSLRRSVREPLRLQATQSPVPGENDQAFDEHTLMPGAWKRG